MMFFLNVWKENKSWTLTIRSLFVILFVMICSNTQAANEVEVLYFGTKDDTAFIGMGQGLEDSAELHEGLSFRLKIESESFRPFNDPKPAVIFAAVDSESIKLLSTLNPDIPIFNLIDDSSLIRNLCLPNVFHIIPGETMRADAIQQWQEKYTNESLQALAWHSKYKLGSAAKLNQKFKDKRGIALTEQGWAGWVAARIFVDGFVKSKHRIGRSLVDFIAAETNFDAHKVVNVSFRSDKQLRQAMLIIDDDKPIDIVPVDNGTDNSLDMLGEIYCF